MESSLGRRSNNGYLAAREAQVLEWLCARMPAFVVPDHLTVLALAGAFITFCGFAASGYNPGFLWLASLGLVINWFGDSLDGSLARYPRPGAGRRYGYFLDCMSDAFCCLMIMIGLGLSPLRSHGSGTVLARRLFHAVHFRVPEPSRERRAPSFLFWAVGRPRRGSASSP